MRPSVVLAVCLLAPIALPPHRLYSQAVRTTKPLKKPTPAAKTAHQDFTLPADQPYCHSSLAYGYISTPSKVTLQVLAKPLSKVAAPSSTQADWAADVSGVDAAQPSPVY